MWSRHLLNCAVVAPAFGPAVSVCDLGSGAGLPGVVLALARPDLEVTLLEPLLRRANFLFEVVSRLGIDATVVRARAEDVPRTLRFDVVTARAVAPLDRLAAWALPLTRPGGELFALKGQRADSELRQATALLQQLGAGPGRTEAFGAGVVDPLTTVVRIASKQT